MKTEELIKIKTAFEMLTTIETKLNEEFITTEKGRQKQIVMADINRMGRITNSLNEILKRENYNSKTIIEKTPLEEQIERAENGKNDKMVGETDKTKK